MVTGGKAGQHLAPAVTGNLDHHRHGHRAVNGGGVAVEETHHDQGLIGGDQQVSKRDKGETGNPTEGAWSCPRHPPPPRPAS